MPIGSGQSLLHYRLVEKLGEGGMGVVWKAVDTTLDREVAIKVLPQALARETDRLARFEREAKLLASLNHPHVAAVYGLHSAGDVRFLAMEFVPGEDLSRILARGPLPIETALSIAHQIAQALEAAHESGVIHRDLKPANVLVDPEGKAKVLDFGLAKAFETEAQSGNLSLSPTMTSAGTIAGVILGTAAYMSPEQARGRAVDRRADIWALGCVLYEMLAGRALFAGETVSDVLAAVLRAEPDWDALPAATPTRVRDLLERCLRRDPRLRIRDIGDVRIALAEILAAPVEPTVVHAAPAGRSRPRVVVIVVLGLALAGLAGFLAGRSSTPTRAALQTRRFELVVPGLTTTYNARPVVSPDGRRLAYVADDALWVRDFSRTAATQVPESRGAELPFWSPDGSGLAFFAGGRLWKVAPSGERPSMLTTLDGTFSGGAGATWGPGGRIVYSRGNTGLLEIRERGGDARVLVEVDGKKESDLHQPYFLPGGRGLLFVTHRIDHGADTLELLDGEERRMLLQLEGASIWNTCWSPTGHILFHRRGTNAGVWALPFSLSTLAVTGEPFLVDAQGDLPSAAADGTLAYVQGATAALQQLVWVDRNGAVLGAVGQPQPGLSRPALSPDGRRAIVVALENESPDLWIHDLERGTKTRLTFTPDTEGGADWSPVDERVTFRNQATAKIEVLRTDGSQESHVRGRGSDPTFTPDGAGVVFASMPDGAHDSNLWLSAAQDGEPIELFQAAGDDSVPRISPDGRYVAYVSHESGSPEVYIRRFPKGDGKWQVSARGGNHPRWSRRGDRLFYREGMADLMEVEITNGPSLRLGVPHRLFSAATAGVDLSDPVRYDVAPGGNRFLMVRNVGQDAHPASIVVVENWIAEFE
jgi:eukaryotic-like serine/threonine-protein kinase